MFYSTSRGMKRANITAYNNQLVNILANSTLAFMFKYTSDNIKLKNTRQETASKT